MPTHEDFRNHEDGFRDCSPTLHGLTPQEERENRKGRHVRTGLYLRDRKRIVDSISNIGSSNENNSEKIENLEKNKQDKLTPGKGITIEKGVISSFLTEVTSNNKSVNVEEIKTQNGIKYNLSVKGVQGPKGDKGDKGDPGPQGDKGATGPVGAVGPQGPIGLTGDKGDQGEVGPQGIQGPQGKTGATGATGPSGATGPQGERGPQGATGPQGPKGDVGPKGDTGEQGTGVTIKGSFDSESNLPATGNSGDAYLVGGDLFVWDGTTWKNVGTIKGPKGDTGAKGPQGIQGEQGPIGPKGDAGAKGATGPQGPKGPKGDPGTPADVSQFVTLGTLQTITANKVFEGYISFKLMPHATDKQASMAIGLRQTNSDGSLGQTQYMVRMNPELVETANGTSIGISTGANTILAGGEAHIALLKAIQTPETTPSVLSNVKATSEAAIVVADQDAYIGSGYQDGTTKPTSGKWWKFGRDGKAFSPSGAEILDKTYGDKLYASLTEVNHVLGETTFDDVKASSDTNGWVTITDRKNGFSGGTIKYKRHMNVVTIQGDNITCPTVAQYSDKVICNVPDGARITDGKPTGSGHVSRVAMGFHAETNGNIYIHAGVNLTTSMHANFTFTYVV